MSLKLLMGMLSVAMLSGSGSGTGTGGRGAPSPVYRNISIEPRSIQSSGSQTSNRFHGDASEIVFPPTRPNPPVVSFNGQRPISSGQGNRNRNHHRDVPIHVLQALANEVNFADVVKKYVTNAKAEEGMTGETILTKLDGKPLQDTQGQKIVVGTRPLPITRVGIYPDAMHSSGGVKVSEQTTSVLSGRNGGVKVAAAAPPKTAQVAPVAVCRPEETTVQVPVDFEPHIIYFPRCVRVHRCGGCCGTDILACEPTKRTLVNVAVRKMSYIGDGNSTNLEFLGQQEVLLEKHEQCDCRCRIKEQDCKERQVYNEDLCLCQCLNREEEERCIDDPEKVWDSTYCDCSCREIKDCNSGYQFNLKTCQCAQITKKKRKRKADAVVRTE